MQSEGYIKGRGAQHQVANRFSLHSHELRDDFLNHCQLEGDEAVDSKTTFIDTFP